MTLGEIKTILTNLDTIQIKLENGNLVPSHFHITEIGQTDKKFIDCGGTIRFEKKVNFQLWYANDQEHRLTVSKLANIISLSEEKLGITDGEIEVEYQAGTIGKYGLEFDGTYFILTNKMTACLAEDACGIPIQKQKIELKQLNTIEANSCCTPGSGCC